MRLTITDIKLIRWVNKMKRVNVRHVEKFLHVSMSNVYRRLKRLVDNGYLVHEQIFHLKPGIYYPTWKGVNAAGDPLSPARVNLTEYEHDLIVTDIALYFEKKYGYWKSEREIRSDKGITLKSQNHVHIPDGLTIIEGKKIAIEVELTQKGKERIKRIFSRHLRSNDYDEVWYLAKSNIKQNLEQHVNNVIYSKIKIFDINEVDKL
jgi:Mn-dependent DtxR family transcriptional regulator